MVPLIAAVALAQDAALQAQLDRIAWSQMVIATCLAVVTLALLATTVAAFMLFRTVRRLVATAEQHIKSLAPKAEPLLSAAGKVAADATGISASVKARTDDVLETIQDVNTRLRRLADEAEGRVREFGAVLDVVQGETREILLDAASTARGVHRTAESLQAARGKGGARRRKK